MKKLYTLLFLLFSTSLISQAQFHLQSADLIENFSTTQVDSFLNAQGVPSGFVAIRNGVKAYRITYSTVSYDSSATVATGVLFLPQGNDACQRPILNYCHGTIIKKADAPSYKVGEYVVGIAFSSNGYITIMPDYLGLGPVSPGLHPYIHAHSEATANIDMIRSSKEYMDSINYTYGDKLFLTGYSQGGHACMATHRMMQQTLPTEFTVTASAPLSGPYDVSGVQAAVITRDSSYGAPGYLPFVLFSYNMVYNLYTNFNNVLDAPYNSTLPPLMDGSVTLGVVENIIPDTPNLILNPLVLDTFETDTSHRFWDALRANNLYDWVPNCPVRMGYCEADELVSFKNAIACRDSMIAHGATDVMAISVNPTLGHGDCAPFSMLAANNFFTTLRTDLVTLSLTVTDESSPGAGDGAVTSTVSGGVPGYTYLWNTTATSPDLTNQGAGIYTLTVTDTNDCSFSQTASIGIVGIEDHNQPTLAIFPNPASNQFTIQLLNFTADMHLTMTDLTGKVTVTKNIPMGTDQLIVNVEGLTKGIYMVKIQSGNYSITRRVVIQ